MSSLDQVERLIQEVESLPLSQILPRTLPIALACKDYKGYCVLSLLIAPIASTPQEHTIQQKEITRPLLLHDLSSEYIAKNMKESVEEALGLKLVTKDQISTHSVKEIEDWILEATATRDSSTDISRASYADFTEHITQIRRMYEKMRGYTVHKLAYYQQIIKNDHGQDLTLKEHQGFIKSSEKKKVFVVHGHNGEMKEAVARLLEKQGIHAIVLHEQANSGATIIEKIERNSDVDCAICLFTADDLGRAKVEGDEHLRARQNVVFEAGYFIGKLGRNKVVLVSDKGVEIPSDLQGVVYTETINWRYSVLKDLKAIGYSIDYNKLD